MTAARKLPEPTLLALDKIRLDGGTQSRAQLSEETITEYSERIVDLPPVDVFFDGESYWLADGFHRHAAFLMAERKRISCIVHQGTQRDAILFSVGANSAHGLRRSNADKRRAVMLLLKDEEWSKKSDRWVAEKCGTGHPLVAKLRSELESDSSSRTREGQDGKTRKLPTAKPRPAPPALCPRHELALVDGACTVCEERTAKGLTVSEPPKSEPRARAAEAAPSHEKWECPQCQSWWPVSIDFCAQCEPDEPLEPVLAFDPRDAVCRVADVFEEVMTTWPWNESREPMLAWLKTQFGMMQKEFERWQNEKP